MIVKSTKTWRKLGIWLQLATQDFEDIKDEASQVLSQAENWWLLSMDEDQAKEISRFRGLSDEKHNLILAAQKERPNFTESVLLSKKHGDVLFRVIPPRFVLALAQTDLDEKAERHRIMFKHKCTELEAAKLIAEQLIDKFKQYQQDKSEEVKV